MYRMRAGVELVSPSNTREKKVIEKFLEEHPLVSFTIMPCAIIAVAGVFMAITISIIQTAF